MQIRKAAEKDEPEIKALWGYCFERPSDPFFSWYFHELYHPEEVLVAEENEHIASDLHRRPYQVMMRGKVFPVNYIVGVATHPAARGQGYAQDLIRGELRLSRKEGKAFSLLMPSSASFYLPMGFGFCCHQWARKASPEALAPLGKKPVSAGTIASEDDWKKLASVYDAFTEGRNNYTVRDEASWRSHIRGQLALASSFIAVVSDDRGPCGYIFYTLDDRDMYVQEMAYSNPEGRQGLYFYMAGHRGSIDACHWYEPLDDHSYMGWNDGAEHTYITNRTFPYMLMRVVDPINAFDGLPCDPDMEGTVAFQLCDSFMPENNGLYVLRAENGTIRALRNDVFYMLKLHIEDISGQKIGDPIPEPAFAITSTILAEWLSGSAPLSCLSREGQIQWLTADEEEKRQLLRTADHMLPAERNWINEWY